MASALALLLAIFKAIPALKSLWDELVAAYVQHEITAMNEELSNAIYQASHGDQRNLEKYIGSPRAGKPSGEPNERIVDELPGVPNSH
jgi:hypothetical protein